MNWVQTVRGSVSPEALGHCQIHEHIFVRQTPMSEKNPVLRIDDPQKSMEELRSFAARGGVSLVDAQPMAAGRDAEALLALSAGSGVHVVASTGYHLLGFYPERCWVHSLEEEDLFTAFLSELAEGMLPWEEDPLRMPKHRTSIRAGMVKAAIPAEGAVGRYAVLLRAAARAAAAAGVPLMLHTEYGQNVLQALELCFGAGVRPEKTVVCHVDRQAADFGPHDAVAAAGVFLDYDTVGRWKYHSDKEEIALLHHMVDTGHAGQILLALDTTAARLRSYGGEIGLDFLLDTFLPMLRADGFSEETIQAFTIRNSKRLFSC